MDYDVLIVGGGPGGYVSAIRMKQYGLNVAVIEKERLGGVCLNWGCIPTKSLVKVAELFKEIKEADKFGISVSDAKIDYQSVWRRKNEIVEQLVSGVEFIFKKREIPNLKETVNTINCRESDYLVETEENNYTAKYIVLATGSKPKTLPFMKFNGTNIMSSRDILKMTDLPEHLVIIGGGVIGCEFASIFNQFGVNVEIVEFLPHLISTEDQEISKRLAMSLKKVKIKIHLNTGVEAYQKQKGKLILELTSGKRIETDKVLLSVGREAQMDIKFPGKELKTKNGFITTDKEFRTNLPDLFAIGDVTGTMMLAHVASKQGLIVADIIANEVQSASIDILELNYKSVPACTYTDPEIASVGISQQEAEKLNKKIVLGKFPFSANGKSLGLGNRFGFVKLIAEEDSGKIIGMHIIGPQATELIAQGAYMIGTNMTFNEIKKIIFAHPTLSECIMEAAEDLENIAVHII
jgi:dihydrolipoamide dehydrogenase